MKLVAMITESSSIARLLTALGEPTDVPGRSPSADVAAAVLDRFAAPHFLAKRSGFLYICAIAGRRRLRSPRCEDSLLHRGAQGWIALTASSSAELGKQDPIFLPSA